MKARITVTLSLLVALTAMLVLTGRFANAGNTAAADVEREAVIAANDKFYDALNAMFEGDSEPFKDVWWHTDDIVYMGADGAYNVGWEQVYSNWEKQAALNIGGKVEGQDVRVSIGEDMAMTNAYTVGFNLFDGKKMPIKLRATSIFHKKDGQWKMICHHVDVIPVLGKSMDGES